MARTLAVLALCTAVALLSPTASPAQANDEAQRIARVENGLTTDVVIAGQPPPKMSLQDRMRHYHTTAVSIAFFDASGIRWVMAYGAPPANSQPVRVTLQPGAQFRNVSRMALHVLSTASGFISSRTPIPVGYRARSR